MSNYNIKVISEILKAKLYTQNSEFHSVKDILIDSRSIVSPSTSVFFALVGPRNDGHNYISELYNKGVRSFVVSKLPDNYNDLKGADFILVDDTLKALQNLAKHHRSLFNIPVIGITGSNGKTIVKEWLFQLLSPEKNIVRSPKSYNSQIGVPLSVWQISRENEIAIFEAGISEPNEMEKIQQIIMPDIGIFTNIGQAHDKNFINTNQKVGEKLKLFKNVKSLIYCQDYFDIQDRIVKSEILKSINFFSWSFKHKSDLLIKKVNKENSETQITAVFKNNDISINIPFTDDASIENAIHCWATMLLLGYNNSKIAAGMKNLISVAMRLELKEGINNCSIINDSYSNDIKSLIIALDFLKQQKQHKKLTVILSDILQSSLPDEELYAEVAKLLKDKSISRFIGIGKAITRNSSKFKMEKEFYPDTDSFLDKLTVSSFYNETILLKGARIFEFEQISKALQQKSHETVLEINLNSLITNLNYYRSKLKPETKVMAMVKAFSYGSGSFEIANVLQYHHVDYLAVAYADEGVELRKAGITVPIMVMNPEEQSFGAIFKYNLEPEIYSIKTLNILIREIADNNLRNKVIPVHIKLDTGMRRLGFEEKEISELIAILNAEKQIHIRSVFTHLVASEDINEDDFTIQQINSFLNCSKKLKAEFGEDILCHVLNSSGISRFNQYQFDMVRLGIGLYGISADDEEQKRLSNVGALKTTISQIKFLGKGDTVGYNRKWTAKRDTQTATIPVGYADGLNRKLGNEAGFVYIKNQKVPIIGNVCMDMCMLDVTGVDVSEGDEVIIFNDAESIKELSACLETIPYEILTNVSRRVKRIYYYE
jgi:alanine racemase